MRPLKLTMQAFGPYKNVQTLDFRELKNNRLFLIHGTTGAGKTTILDAICYALYGDTSGKERTGSQMRSESADPDRLTQVVFDFALGTKCYRVLREPQQQKAATRGNKESLVNHSGSVILWEIDESGCEKSMLDTGSRKVDARVEQLIGFSSEQFRQVVVLPQGKFRELLVADSKKREDILRQLFRTDEFASIEGILADRAREIIRKRDELKTRRSEVLRGADAEDDEVLNNLTTQAADAVNHAKETAQKAEKKKELAAEKLNKAEAQMQVVSDLNDAKDKLLELEKQKPAIDAQREAIKISENATRVEPCAQAAYRSKNELAEATENLEKVQNQFRVAKSQVDEACRAFDEVKKNELNRSQAHELLRKLKEQEGQIEELFEAQEKKNRAQREHDEAIHKLHTAEDAVKAAKIALDVANEYKEQAGLDAGQLTALKAEKATCESSREKLEQLAEAKSKHTEAVEEQAQAQSKYEISQKEAELSDARYKKMDDEWRAGRAGALAQSLHSNTPCPVCGSLNHPQPAQQVEGVDDDALENARLDLSNALANVEAARKTLESANSKVAILGERVATISEDISSKLNIDAIYNRVAELEEEISRIEERINAKGDPIEFVANTKKSLEVAENNLKTEQEAERNALSAVNVFVENVRLLAQVIPESLQSKEALSVALKDAQAECDLLDESFKAAQDYQTAAQEAFIKAETDLKHAVDVELSARQKNENDATAMKDTLQKYGFKDSAQYENARMPEKEQRDIRAQISAYDESVASNKTIVKQLEKAIPSTNEEIDIEALRTEVIDTSEEYSLAVSTKSDAESRLENLKGTRARLEEIDSENTQVNEQYAVVGELSEVANGRSGGAKISLQRWVLGTYLDEVLNSASKRFLTMSKGRYLLRRDRGITNYKQVAGLDLEVFDTWSNRGRPVVTLSGGESFLAALSLALGLAEVVQEQAGGTRLDTVFIDEGFGALDQDALDLAMSALIDLKDTGRLVGVISHVPELRQTIDARLEVSSGDNGSRAKFMVG